MVRFSRKATGSSKTTNRAGGEAFNMAPIEQLVQIVTTNLMSEPKYYGDVQKVMDNAIEAVAKTNPEFILKLASYTRNEMYLRTISVYLLVKAANMPETKQFVRQYTPYVLRRADEIYEALACHIQVFSDREYPKTKGGYKIPNSLKKGIADTFKNFDEYQFAKYNRPTGVGFKFAIMKCRPKEPSEIIKKILDDKLETPYTWETELSEKGNKPEVWHQLIDSGRVGYMALLRNLNSMDRAKVDELHYTKVLDTLSNPDKVRKSKQFPFRFYSALKNTTIEDPFKKKETKKALNKALNVSVDNLPKLKGRTFTVADTSGSMQSSISGKSKIQHINIACLMTAMTHKFSENAIAGIFGTNLKIVDDLTGDLLTDTEKLESINVGWSTNGYLTLRHLNEKQIFCDRVIIFTDEELWDSYGDDGSLNKELEKYKKVNPNILVYLVNLNGYGETCLPRNKNVVSLSGWSEKILNFISVYEQDRKSFVEKINAYTLKGDEKTTE